MPLSCDVRPSGRADLIARTTQIRAAIRSGSAIPCGCRTGQPPRRGSGRRGASPPADRPRQGSVPAAPPWRMTCTALVPGSSAISNARGVVSTVPDPGSYRRPCEPGSARSSTRNAPPTTQNDCTSSVSDSSIGLPTGHATCHTWYADVSSRIVPVASVGRSSYAVGPWRGRARQAAGDRPQPGLIGLQAGCDARDAVRDHLAMSWSPGQVVR